MMLILTTGHASPAQTPPPAQVRQAKPDMVIKWNEYALQAIRQDRATPLLAARSRAIMPLAFYAAVRAIERPHQPSLVDGTAAPGTSADAAVTAAAHRT